MTESKVKAKHDLAEDRSRVQAALRRMEHSRPSRAPCDLCGSPDCLIGARFHTPQYDPMRQKGLDLSERGRYYEVSPSSLRWLTDLGAMSYISDILAVVELTIRGRASVVLVDDSGRRHAAACGVCHNCRRQMRDLVDDMYLSCAISSVPTATLISRREEWA
jgi:hypothetical protein